MLQLITLFYLKREKQKKTKTIENAMDAFSLKKDNRKKFQDKQKLKRKHATPSDRKYRLLNRQKEEKATTEEKEQDQEQPALKSNEDRYYEDPVLEDPHSAVANAELNKVLKDVLKNRLQQNDDATAVNNVANKDTLKIKDLKQMSTDELNRWLGRQNTTSAITAAEPESSVVPLHVQGDHDRVGKKISAPSTDLPEELETDQDFLDGLL